jgi:hypothetical protein
MKMEKHRKIRIIFALVAILSAIIVTMILVNESQASEDVEYEPHSILFVTDNYWGENVPSILEKFRYLYGWDVTTTAVNKTVTSCLFAGSEEMEVDVTLDNLTNWYMFDCVSILPGQYHENLINNGDFHEMIRNLIAKGTIVTAWCRAVRILARADVIDGRDVTGYDAYQEEYEAAGATFHYRVPPIADGNVITSVRSLYYQLRTCELIRTTVENNKPELWEFSTYLGGTGDERGQSASLNYLGDTVVDSEGNLIIGGRTESDDFPILNPYQETRNGGIDATISKFYPNGTLIFSTYFGGSAHEWITGIAVDTEDNIVFAGITGSSNFPIQNPYQATHHGGLEGNADCFIAKLSADGQLLLYSTFYGGTGSDWCYEMNIDNTGRIAITGTTNSYDFPLENAYQSSTQGGLEAYVAVLEADGQSLAYSSYLGSSSTDHGRGLDFDSEGNLFMTGIIGNSNHGTSGVYQPEFGGSSDAYVAKFDTSGSLEFFTYLGGTYGERANDLRIDPYGNILVTGYTGSDDFPTRKAVQRERGGWNDIFITKFDPLAQEMIYSTYYGGSNIDEGYAIVSDDNGNAILTGITESSNFETTGSSKENMDDRNAILLKLNPKGKLMIASELGGEDRDVGVGIAWHSNSSYIITGFTCSDEFPIYHAVQGEYGGNYDMFVMKLNTILLESQGLEAWLSGIITGGVIAGFVGSATIIVVIQHKRT